ncbi:MAG: hypothetical protein LC802_13470 [Acidobacteria bacterium]|nr:hypothetical protein [Acidobacteriota bacterium]
MPLYLPETSDGCPNVRRPAFLTTLSLLLLILPAPAHAQKKRRAPAGGRVAVVVDERLSALRDAPSLSANMLRRIGRGRLVAIARARESADGVMFYRVVVTRRTGGWLHSDALVTASRAGDDERLLRLVRGSAEFDRIERARIFLETFPRSTLRPAVLLLFGEAAEEAAARLSRDAARRLDEAEMEAGGAPLRSYYLSFNGLDRFNRVGVRFVFDSDAKRFHYDGAAWREILRRYPRSPEAAEARRHLEALKSSIKIN